MRWIDAIDPNPVMHRARGRFRANGTRIALYTVMWVRAMQAVLYEIADMTTSNRDADKDREIEQTGLSYLQRHPQAADTLDGIVRWWLPQQRYSVAQARIEAALRRLVSQGLIRQRRLPTGDALYVRGGPTAVADDDDDNEQR